jgi:hypothetical protein
MVNKEWRCVDPECGYEFEGFVDICPHCASDARRVFRTAPGVATNKGRPMAQSKIHDGILTREFDRQGIANFTNVGGENKVTWRGRVQQKFPGVYCSNASGLPNQSNPIQGMIARPGDFSQLQQKYGADPNSFRDENGPYRLPQGVDNSFEGLEPTPPVKVGKHRPEKLMRQTQVIRHPEGDPKISQGAVDEVLRQSS